MKKTLKRMTAIVISFTMVFGVPCYTKDKTPTVQAADEYEVVWEDNFDGNSLDRSIWNVEQNGDGGGNQELQYYRDSTDNIQVSNGTLKIKGLRQGYGGKNYTSGRINTKGKAEFRYGKIEARMKLPSFSGAWPAFWMLGGNHSSIGWPRCGEIDIMEAINTEKFTHGALHWFGESGQGDSGGDSQKIVPADFDRTQWHVYGIVWDEKKMDFTVDGQVFFSDSITDGYKGEFRKEQFIILNLAIGGQWPGFSIDNSAFPATMEVDYVRVSQKKSDKNIITGTGVTEQRPNLIPSETVTRNVLEGKGYWSLYFNNAVVQGTGKNNGSKGFEADIGYLGITSKAIRATLTNVDYIPGETYQYSFSATSSIDKNITVKVVGEDQIEDVFANYNISLQAGSTYHFTNSVKIDKNYDGRLDLIIIMGGRIGGEYMDADTSLSIHVTDVSFVGKVDKSIQVPTSSAETTTYRGDNNVTTKAPSVTTSGNVYTTVAPTKKEVTTAELSGKKVTAPKRTTVKKAEMKKNTKKVNVTFKRVQGAKGYKLQISGTKKFQKILVSKTVKSVKAVIKNKKLLKNKKLYVRVKAYSLDDKRKVWAKQWSKVKKIKMK